MGRGWGREVPGSSEILASDDHKACVLAIGEHSEHRM